MTTEVGPTGYKIKLADLSDQANIQTALNQVIYGTTSAPTNVAGIDAKSIFGTLAPKASPTFTGTVTASGATSVVLPTDTTIGSVSSTEIGYLDGVTSSIQTQFGNITNSDIFWFGSGADGSVTLNNSTSGYGGWATRSGSAGSYTYTLFRDVYFTSLTIASGFILNPNGFRIFVNGTLTLSGSYAITNPPADGTNGGNRVGSTGGTAGVGGTITANLNSYYGNASSGTNGGGGANAASNGNNGSSNTTVANYPVWFDVYTPSVGANGSGGFPGYTQGAGGTSAAPVVGINWKRAFVEWSSPFKSGVPVSSAGGTGGGGGTNGTSGAGGGGGGGGSGNTGVFIYAKTISFGNAANIIRFVGGNGGAGGAGTVSLSYGGGGAGGQGGFVYIAYKTATGTSLSTQINVSGGNGGTPSNDVAPGGYSGAVAFVNLSTGTMTINAPVAPSGRTGGVLSVARPS